MVFGKKNKFPLVNPLKGKMNIIRIRNQRIDSKYAIIDILELEKSQFTFISPLSLPTDPKVVYGFEFTIFNRLFQLKGGIVLLSKEKDEYIYQAVIQSDDHNESEMLFEINQLAAAQNKEYGKITKSYDPQRFDDVIVNYVC